MWQHFPKTQNQLASRFCVFDFLPTTWIEEKRKKIKSTGEFIFCQSIWKKIGTDFLPNRLAENKWKKIDVFLHLELLFEI